MVSSSFKKKKKLHTKKNYWVALPARSHCLSSIFMHYVLNSAPPTKIISSLHKIQIIGEWHDLTNEPQPFDGWCESPRGEKACFFLAGFSTSGWLTGWLGLGLLLHHEGSTSSLAYQRHKCTGCYDKPSLFFFANYFTHYGSSCVCVYSLAPPPPPHPALCIQYLRMNTQQQQTL